MIAGAVVALMVVSTSLLALGFGSSVSSRIGGGARLASTGMNIDVNSVTYPTLAAPNWTYGIVGTTPSGNCAWFVNGVVVQRTGCQFTFSAPTGNNVANVTLMDRTGGAGALHVLVCVGGLCGAIIWIDIITANPCVVGGCGTGGGAPCFHNTLCIAPMTITEFATMLGGIGSVSDTVSWGDGTYSTGTGASHTYSGPNQYTLQWSIQDSGGHQSTATETFSTPVQG